MSEEARKGIRQFIGKTAAERVDSFTYGGTELEFRAIPDGEIYIGVMFPDPNAAVTASKHAAKVNNRTNEKGELRPYPIEIYGDVLAILHTYQNPPDEAPLDINEVFRLYDDETELFCLMRGSALEIIGVGGGDAKANSGLPSWTATFGLAVKAHRLLKEGKPDEAIPLLVDLFQVSRAAIGDYKLNPRDVVGDLVKLDPELESILGN